MPINLINKIFFSLSKIFNHKVLSLIVILFLFYGSSLFTIVSALTNTSTTTGVNSNQSSDSSPKTEEAQQPCSIYDYDWGYSQTGHGLDQIYPASVGSLGGLYGTVGQGGGWIGVGGTSADEKTFLKYFISQSIKKDPIFFNTGFDVSADDPILGAIGDDGGKIDATKTIGFNRDQVQVPCVRGNVSGILAKRNASDSLSSKNNCNSRNPYILCELDNIITRRYTPNPVDRLGGCTLDMYSKTNDKKEPYGDPNKAFFKTFVGNVAAINANNVDIALKDNLIRIIYSEGDVIDRTINNFPIGESTTQTDNINYARSIDNMKKYYDQFINSSINGPTSGLTITKNDFMYSDNNNKVTYDTSSFPLSLFKNDFLFKNQEGQHLASWFLKSDIPLPTSENIKDLFYINKNVFDNIANTSFVCSRRMITITPSNNKPAFQIPLYEWIPGFNNQYSAPTCDLKAVGSNVASTTSTTTATGKKIIICTPCLLPNLFTTDIFGQPVYGIPTAIGCLPSSLNGLIAVLLRVATMTAGGIALLIITISGVKVALNSDNPEEIKKSQKGITSAVTGLLVILSAVLLLNLVGLRILDLGSFGGNEISYVTVGQP